MNVLLKSCWNRGEERTVLGHVFDLYVALGLGLVLAGCAVGPNYRRPTALGTNAVPATFSVTEATNQGSWKRAEPSAHLPRGAWWELFGDPELNRLEVLSAGNNQQLAAAFANLQQARALVNVARADFFPQISSPWLFTRQQPSQNQVPNSSALAARGAYNSFSASLTAGWELDLFGRIRRLVESARARLEASADDLESTKLAIQAELAIDYFALRALEAQDRLLQATAVVYRRSVELTQDRHNSGIATELDVSQAETQLQSTLAQIPAIEAQHDVLLHALAALCGQAATGFTVGPAGKESGPTPIIPVSVPSELLEQRPDIAAAERSVAAANADVGVAQAAFYPRVMLNGLAGYQSVDLGTLFNWPSHFWSVGPSVQVPLFTGGRNRAQLEAARAVYDATVANYRQTVITAFREVEDQLSQQQYLARELEAETAALNSARRTLDISNTRYKGGVITYLDVVIAQSVALSHEQSVVQLNAQRLTAAVSLIKALGGGWSVELQAKTAVAESPSAGQSHQRRGVQ
jgi:multidrug efflux system outer membrane protein